MKKTIGILAHVDAGKTTFSEQVLFHTGAIRSAGRVDHKDAFLDLHPIERERGITVFSDQALFDMGENRYFWLDTPGHADFAAEMERVLPVLDFAVLIVSCAEGVESHTETIWQLLEQYSVPAMIFVNKTDRPDADFSACLASIKKLLSPDAADLRSFDGSSMDEAAAEAVAERDEELLDRLMCDDYDFETWRKTLCREIAERRIFPVFAGAALQQKGVREFLAAMDGCTDTVYEEKSGAPFAARVYKIRHDDKGMRQVYFKVLAGTLSVKDEIETAGGFCKINDLRLCHGPKFQPVNTASAGDIVCTGGLPGVRAGDGLGTLAHTRGGIHTEPMLEVSVNAADPSVAKTRLLQALRMLEEEDPALRVRADSRSGELSLRVMGGIQTEIIARLAMERFNIGLEFGPPRILYMETIAEETIGIGHYEPLKHYAEVWLRLVPAEPGSGISFVSKCHVDDLALNWQRLIETHVFERSHPGVLTGAPLTDVRMELLAGRAHLKHTEGGDFRQSTYRAIRNGLMYAKNILLEPVCRFKLRMPENDFGRIMGDLSRMQADCEAPVSVDEWMIVEGSCPYRLFADYPETFRAATHGRGSVNMRLEKYAPVENQDAIVSQSNYNPHEDDSPDSVFCSHGAGHIVPWNEVRANAHCSVDGIQF